MKKSKPLNPMIPVQNAQLLAIEGVLENTMESFERKVRRWFSKEHSTPYLDTFDIPWDELLLHYYESRLANMSYNEVFDLAVEEFLPEFVKISEEEDQAFADSLLKEQEAALKAKKAKAKQSQGSKKITQQEASCEAKKEDKAQSVKKHLDKKINQPIPKEISLRFNDSDPDSSE